MQKLSFNLSLLPYVLVVVLYICFIQGGYTQQVDTVYQLEPYSMTDPLRHAVDIRGIPQVERPQYFFDEDGGQLTIYDNRTAYITGVIVNRFDPRVKWRTEIWLKNERSWTEWSSLGRRAKGDTTIMQDNYLDWTFWELNDSLGISQFIFVGTLDDLQGDTLIASHMPSDYNYGFQLGLAANDKTADFGFSGWFTFEEKNNSYNCANSNSCTGDFNNNIDTSFTPILPPICEIDTIYTQTQCINPDSFSVFITIDSICGTIFIKDTNDLVLATFDSIATSVGPFSIEDTIQLIIEIPSSDTVFTIPPLSANCPCNFSFNSNITLTSENSFSLSIDIDAPDSFGSYYIFNNYSDDTLEVQGAIQDYDDFSCGDSIIVSMYPVGFPRCIQRDTAFIYCEPELRTLRRCLDSDSFEIDAGLAPNSRPGNYLILVTARGETDTISNVVNDTMYTKGAFSTLLEVEVVLVDKNTLEVIDQQQIFKYCSNNCNISITPVEYEVTCNDNGTYNARLTIRAFTDTLVIAYPDGNPRIRIPHNYEDHDNFVLVCDSLPLDSTETLIAYEHDMFDICTRQLFITPDSCLNGGINGFRIYQISPNLLSDKVAIRYSTDDKVNLKWVIKNTAGQTPTISGNKELEIGDNSLTIDSSNLSSGIYTIIFYSNQKVISTQRFVKE